MDKVVKYLEEKVDEIFEVSGGPRSESYLGNSAKDQECVMRGVPG